MISPLQTHKQNNHDNHTRKLIHFIYQQKFLLAQNFTLHKFKIFLTRDVSGGFHLRPLDEFVDGDVEVAVAPDCVWEWSQDVQPPDREQPGEGDGMKSLRGLMYLLSMELTCFAGLDELGGVLESCGPVEAAAECFASQGA